MLSLPLRASTTGVEAQGLREPEEKKRFYDRIPRAMPEEVKKPACAWCYWGRIEVTSLNRRVRIECMKCPYRIHLSEREYQELYGEL